jgi:putative hydrolase of the HAD superfamily
LPDTQIDAVLFDYGQVLSEPPDPAAWARLIEQTGLDQDTLHREYWLYRHAYDEGVYTGVSYWQQIASDTNRSYPPGQIESFLDTDFDLWARPNQPMQAWLQHLQRENMRTGILSNIGDAMTARFLARMPWLGSFYHCTWSYALRLAKPDPAIYRAAIASLDTPPDRILFIDDIERNIAPARDLGLHAIQYHPGDHPRFLEELKAIGLLHLLEPAAR